MNERIIRGELSTKEEKSGRNKSIIKRSEKRIKDEGELNAADCQIKNPRQ